MKTIITSAQSKDSAKSLETCRKNEENTEKENPYNIFYDNYLETTSSGTECTGLIPRGDVDLSEWENYKDIFPFGG